MPRSRSSLAFGDVIGSLPDHRGLVLIPYATVPLRLDDNWERGEDSPFPIVGLVIASAGSNMYPLHGTAWMPNSWEKIDDGPAK
jgi:hypothetical protein